MKLDMANIIELSDVGAPELDVYVRLTGAQLRNKLEPERGIFIAESPTVIDVALKSGCTPISLLTDKRLINSDVSDIIERCGDIPIYTADRDTLTNITGFELTRGALCAMKRPSPSDYRELIRDAKRIAILEDIADSTNIGALFRSAAALGIDAVLLSPRCCDPLCRRAVRVSMGNTLLIPFARIPEGEWPSAALSELRGLGIKSCAMALTDKSVSLDDKELLSEEKLAIILGTEGTGLIDETISLSDYTVRIPMERGVDSLNVAAAGAIAFYQITRKNI